MNWWWVAIAATLPLLLGLAVAWPFFGRSRDSLGSVVGAFIAFAFAIAFVGREYVQIQALTQRCLDEVRNCRFYPEPFTRFCIYGFIALVQVFLLFVIGSAVESRKQARSFAPEWRR
jgi:hypothetical protein